MKIDNLLNAINEIKEKASEHGIQLEECTLWSDSITFEELSDGLGNPIFASYYCERDEIEYE